LLEQKPDATYSDLMGAVGHSDPSPDPELGLGTLNVRASLAGS
jgi:hypothetical protein